ncbi:testis-specific expressed protein 55 [Perognathus longimembris pacificus]|uniref:testis-specific expressed protein 55 n=1 Tax=Perognathus longimembris pacificus TaxID=214514 RepID=UPI002018E13C|nr:testis-specific expressed protein 55 [Perognathus longimembris pacificus]
MDPPPEKHPDESWEQENTTTPSTADQTNNGEDNQKNQAEGEEANAQTNADHIDQSSYEQSYSIASNQLGQIDQSGQGTYEQSERKWSKKIEGNNSQQTGQIEERTSQASDQKLSQQSDRKASRKSSDKVSSSDGRSSAHIDYRFPALSVQGPSIPTTQKDRVNYRTSGSAEDTGEQSAEQFMDEGEDDLDDLFKEKEGHEDYYPGYHQALNQLEDQIFSDLVDDEAYDFRIQPCKFEESSNEVEDKLSVDMENETESATAMPSYKLMDTRFTNIFQTQDQAFTQKLSSSKAAYLTSEEGLQTIQASNSGLYVDGKSQGYKRRLPPIIYEDPYQISLQYMEKHHILQIFQHITEKLVYEKPDDPLNFMLHQVQEMIQNRDNM